MPKVLSVVGRSNSGKTTVIERVVSLLVARGWRVGTLKHDVHGFEMDHEGKDTYRHFESGAHRVAIAGPFELAYRERLGSPVESGAVVARLFEGMDLVLTEGYKTGSWPKVEVVRAARSPEPLCVGDPTLRAVVTDLPGPWPVPAFRLDDADGLANWVEREFLGGER